MKKQNFAIMRLSNKFRSVNISPLDGINLKKNSDHLLRRAI